MVTWSPIAPTGCCSQPNLTVEQTFLDFSAYMFSHEATKSLVYIPWGLTEFSPGARTHARTHTVLSLTYINLTKLQETFWLNSHWLFLSPQLAFKETEVLF